MQNKHLYGIITGGLTLVWLWCVVSYGKLTGDSMARLFGLPVLPVTALLVGLALAAGLRWRPVRQPGEDGATPGCLLWGLMGLFVSAIALGTYFTEPIICTARDGNVCYRYGTVYETQRADGTPYRFAYRNTAAWVTDSALNVITAPGRAGGAGVSGGSAFDVMDLGDSDLAALIIILVALVLLVLASAFVPNLWVPVAALCLVGLCLSLIRIHHYDTWTPDEKPKNAPPPEVGIPSWEPNR
ncbi:MAG: hypothetical protein MUE40_17085 [Anaerolineae bacterium]|jgi:hypothetical protein|nr:hypothetical protein [Anaerolineae bacterium]